MTILVDNQQINLILLRARGRRMKMSFDKDKNLVVQNLSGVWDKITEDFVQKNIAWIQKNYQKTEVKSGKREHFLQNLATHIPYKGQEFPIYYEVSHKRAFQIDLEKGIVISHLPNDDEKVKNYVISRAVKRLAEHYLIPKTLHWAKITQHDIRNVVVKGQKTRWGSCSTKHNINLNWHLIFLREELIDYLLVHELMHLHEMNHSAKFWQWVERYCPNYEKLDKELNENGYLIGILDS
jgi:predicted metal-dependent hydrolase